MRERKKTRKRESNIVNEREGNRIIAGDRKKNHKLEERDKGRQREKEGEIKGIVSEKERLREQ